MSDTPSPEALEAARGMAEEIYNMDLLEDIARTIALALDRFAERRVEALPADMTSGDRWRPISEPIVGFRNVWLAHDDGVTLVHVDEDLDPDGYEESITHWMPACVPAAPTPASKPEGE